jgi:hypothetical protein
VKNGATFYIEWNCISEIGLEALWMDCRVELDGYIIVHQGYTKIFVDYLLPE